jgi:phage replication initiation protein
VLPYDMLTRPGVYLAGAYACLGFLSVIQEKVRTIAKAVKITLGALLHYARQGYGPLVNVLMAKHQGNAGAVVAELIRPGIPRRLAPYADNPRDFVELAQTGT